MIIGLWPDENEVGQGVMKRKKHKYLLLCNDHSHAQKSTFTFPK